MHFKLGIVGHMKRIEVVKDTLNEIYKNIEFTTIECDLSTRFVDVIKKIKYHEHYLNGIYFTGINPYKISMSLTTPKIRWGYMTTDNSQLLSAFIELQSKHLGNLNCISIDTYTKKNVLEIYELIGIDKLPPRVNISTLDILKPNFLINNFKFHLDSYKKNGSVCITNISDTFNSLKEINIPTILLKPSKESIRNDFQEMLMEYQLLKKIESKNIIFQLSINYYKDPVISLNNYKILSEKSRLVDILYLIAQKTSGVLMENSKGGYIILSNKDIFDKNISNRALLGILHDLSKAVSTSVSVGIGYGKTPYLAQVHSNNALNKAEASGGNKAFIAYDEANILGPLIPKEIEYSDTTIFDDLISEIVNSTNLSSKTVQKFVGLKSNQSKEFFTPKELASEFGVTHRTMNKIIGKLEMAGYLKLSGKKMLSNSGRPTRIFKLNI